MIRCLVFVSLLFFCQASVADDWARFRGPAGGGVASETETIPAAWSPNANIGWKTALPGPGASSPIVVGGKIFVTCYSGYGVIRNEPGVIEDLVRHLVCVDLKTGQKIWQQDVDAALPEDPYTGIGVTAHGYASHTPVSDGKNVYAFFGKSGVHAFDLAGNKLWHADVGKESDPNKWGSSSSPVLYKNTVIVTASAESQSIRGLDKETGKELWRQDAKGLDGMWGTPTLVKIDDDRTDLVMCVAKELWGLDPNSGELRWFADATGADNAYSSVVLDGKRVFVFAGRGGGSVAVDAGGSGDISKTNTVWTGRDNASFPSPVRYKSKLVVVTKGIVTVVDAESGKRVQRLRLKGATQSGGRSGSLDYPSPIVVGDHLYYLNGSGEMFVFKGKGEGLEQVASNRVTTDKEVFWGTPAVSDGRMIMRSSKHLYCVTDKAESVDRDPEKLAATDAPLEDDGANEDRSGGRRGGGGGGRRPDPTAMFADLDKDQDGQVSEMELGGHRMADRLKTLDKDGDKAISKSEFTSGVGELFSRGGGRGGDGQNKKPDRPQRPKMAGV